MSGQNRQTNVPTSPNNGPEFDQCWPNLAGPRPELVHNSARFRIQHTDVVSESAKFGPNSANVGPMLTRLGPPNSGHLGRRSELTLERYLSDAMYAACSCTCLRLCQGSPEDHQRVNVFRPDTSHDEGELVSLTQFPESMSSYSSVQSHKVTPVVPLVWGLGVYISSAGLFRRTTWHLPGSEEVSYVGQVGATGVSERSKMKPCWCPPLCACVPLSHPMLASPAGARRPGRSRPSFGRRLRPRWPLLAARPVQPRPELAIRPRGGGAIPLVMLIGLVVRMRDAPPLQWTLMHLVAACVKLG